jgi:hypothetical protein
MQIFEIMLKVCLVVLPGQPIYSGCGTLLEFEECLLEEVQTEMVEERGEPFLLVCLAACRMRSNACDTLARF